MRIFSGIQPTGAKHLGNYSGGFRQYAATQEQGDAFFCIVDLHSITVDYDPADLRERTLDLAALLFATGLDPERSTVFAQSHVTAHAEAAWLLSAVTSYGQLGRMTQFKEKGDRQEFVSAGLFTYPVLMAGDILLYQTDIVPIGDDQRQHLELARDVAERFNTRFGETFTVPDGVYPEIGARIMDLQEPTKKMSTTGGTPQGTVLLLDPPDVDREEDQERRHRLGQRGAPRRRQAGRHEPDRHHDGRHRRDAPRRSRPATPDGGLRAVQGRRRRGRRRAARRRSRAATPSCAATRASSRGCSRSAPTRRGRRRRRRCARCTSGWVSSRLASRTPTPVFTTRPELRGTFGAVASTHWLASSTGMSVLERGGNAFDAAVAAGFVLQVVEPHLNGPGGDLPVVFWPADRGEPLVLCAQGVSPAAATIERFRELGHELVPGTGPLAACVPGAFGGWLLLLLEFGTLAPRGRSRLRDRVRRGRLSGRPRDRRGDRGGGAAAGGLARLGRALPAAAAGRIAVSQPRPRRDLAPAARRVAGRLARARARARAARVLRGLRRRGDRPRLPRRRRAARPATISRPGGRRSSRLRRSTIAASRSARRAPGARAPPGCSSCACSRASTSRSSGRRSSCTC